jgi:hypothetical protein
MKALDKDLDKYDAKLDADLTLNVDRRERTNIALRLNGQDILLSLQDCGDHMSIDISNFDADGERAIDAFAITEGSGTDRISGNLMIVMAQKDPA